jgi:hypothetical protein
MSYAAYALLLAFGLFFGAIISLEVGRRIAIQRSARGDKADAGLGAVEGAVFGLFGLIVAFTFSGAASRFDARRHLIVEETNAIGTAYLRVDLLSPQAHPAMRESFRRYLDARLGVYEKISDAAAARAELAVANKLQGEIWRQAVSASRSADAHPDAAKLLLPALNEMIDITTTRTMATQMHPPPIMFVLLFGLALISALLAGYSMASGKQRSWLHIVCFAGAAAIAIYVILDLEYPRLGLIRISGFDQAMIELRQGMEKQ